MSDYFFKDGKFVIEDYDGKSAFCSFLPGIAGLSGTPLWAFYINRGQGIAGFGVKDKGSPIMEFYPAEHAYAHAPAQGFRTFVKAGGRTAELLAHRNGAKKRMEVFRSGFAVAEEGEGYAFRAEYFGLPEKPYAALVRKACYTNRSQSVQEFELLDGLAQLIPYGLSNSSFKESGNLMKSWMCVEDAGGAAFFRMRSSTNDGAEVQAVGAGNFYLPVGAEGARIAVDPKIVFGEDYTKASPERFAACGDFDALLDAQNTENEIPCAFTYAKVRLAAGESVTWYSLAGYAACRETAAHIAGECSPETLEAARARAAGIAEEIAGKVCTHTARPLFDAYVKQCYFDNVLRGGMPVRLGDKVCYVYSRKHGDPERDYNWFSIQPAPYSSGNGSFRDVAQNRRNDAAVTPECGDFNIRYFFSLVQADGYNPLSVTGTRYTLKEGVTLPACAERARELAGGFTVGDLCEKAGVCSSEAVGAVLQNSDEHFCADFSEGYWTDHFVYLIDLVTAYLSVYPDRRRELLYETQLFYFDSGVRLLPAARRSVLRADGKVRRYYSLEEGGAAGRLCTKGGEPFTLTLDGKIFNLILMKGASLDPSGTGIDMLGGKPGWNDAANGLPALFGANVADLIELSRLLKEYRALTADGGELLVAREQADFFEGLLRLLEGKPSAQAYCDGCEALRETFLSAIDGGVSGELAAIPRGRAEKCLGLLAERIAAGLAAAKKLGGGMYPTYVVNEPTRWRETGEKDCKGRAYVLPEAFATRALPVFAEGIAKAITVGEREQFALAKASGLYDPVLKVYRSSVDLDGESMEIGRIRSFTKGWLERESCFLHMNYKLMLSLLSAGMYEEFFAEAETNLVPFMDPAVYGRSTLENSSFIATSNHCDKGKWGRGFQARLTGANAELLSMWRIIMGVEKPFTVENGELVFALAPKLRRDWLEKGKASFLLLGRTQVEYRVPEGVDTYAEGVKVRSYKLHGDGWAKIEGETLRGGLAERVRAGDFKKIEVEVW